ncbi:MAG: gamma-glutamyltransferase, partial [Planctomycetota bacterium]
MRSGRAALVLLLLSCASPIRLEYRPGQVASGEARGVVAAEDGIAAEVGAAVLREGGNAVDAAVATAFALGVTFPQAGNPGGGGFAVVALPGEAPVALDFRETAPAGASREMFLRPDGEPDRERSLWTVAAAGVPGTPAGLAALHARFGRLPWARLVEPAEKLAAEGFPIPAGLARALNAHRERFERSAAARGIFVLEDRPWREGDVLVQGDLARTLASIREHGAEGFYRGRVAAAIAEEVRAAGGVLTEGDLDAYRPVWREPARFAFRGSEVLTMPLPSSGGVVLRQILGVLEATGGPDAAPGSPERIHLFAEAERRAFADRNALLGDPAGMPRGLVRFLTSRDYVRRRAATVDPVRATPSGEVRPAATAAAESAETTNLCVVDREGGAVALTYTLNATFGTHIVAEGTGVILNNEMDDFAAKPGTPNQFGLRQGERNAVVPGRRMLSSMSPTLVRRDGRVVLAVGSPGGPRILSAVAQVIVGHVGDGLPIDIAVIAPRVHHQHLPDVLFLEDAEVVWPEARGRGDLGLG